MTSKNTNATLTLTTVSRADDIQKNTFTYPAYYCQKNDAYYISYKDEEPNIIIIKPNEVRLSKPNSNTVLCFEQGCEHVSNYMTPVGKMNVSVFTHKLLNSFCEKQRVFIKYRLDFNGSVTTENDITIKIQENKK